MTADMCVKFKLLEEKDDDDDLVVDGDNNNNRSHPAALFLNKLSALPHDVGPSATSASMILCRISFCDLC